VLWADTHENSSIIKDIMKKRKFGDQKPGLILIVGFGSHPPQFTDAILKSPLAEDLRSKGVDVHPPWANGAKVLIGGLTSDILEKSGHAVEELKVYHVLCLPEDEETVQECLMQLPYRIRPRAKRRMVLSLASSSRADSASMNDDASSSKDLIRVNKRLPATRFLLSTLSRSSSSLHEGQVNDESSTMGEDDSSMTEETRNGDAHSIWQEHFCTTRTFIDVTKSARIGWNPRSLYTKSSGDRLGIDSGRRWMQ